MFRKRLVWVAGVVAIAGMAGCGGKKEESKVETAFVGEPQAVVGTVGEAQIHLEEVDKLVGRWAARSGGAAGDTSERELQRRALDNIIDRILLAQEAEKSGMVPDDAFMAQYMEMVKSGFPSPEAFQARLQQEGMTEEQLYSELRKDLAISNYMQASFPDTVQVSAGEARSYYDGHPDEFLSGESVHARHILVQVEPTASEEQKASARRRAERLLDRLRGGAEFASVARDSSDCPSASRGGDLGFFGRGAMVPPFEAAVFALEAGGMSDIVETQFGYHIIRLEEKKASAPIPYDPTLEGQLTQHLKQEKQKVVFDKRLAELRAAAKIEKKL